MDTIRFSVGACLILNIEKSMLGDRGLLGLGVCLRRQSTISALDSLIGMTRLRQIGLRRQATSTLGFTLVAGEKFPWNQTDHPKTSRPKARKPSANKKNNIVAPTCIAEW